MLWNQKVLRLSGDVSVNKILKHVGAISGLIAFIITLSACRPNEVNKCPSKELVAQFELGQVVYKKINNEKVIIIKNSGISRENCTRLYRVSTATEKNTDYFYEFELVKEISASTTDSRNEIRY